jgi:hypothetical protein
MKNREKVTVLVFLIPFIVMLILSLVDDVIELVQNFNYKSFIKFMQLIES